MCPEWFEFEDVPYSNMWPDDYLWYPHLLGGKYFGAYFLFEGIDRVLKSEISLSKEK